jgi:hypothetical protein
MNLDRQMLLMDFLDIDSDDGQPLPERLQAPWAALVKAYRSVDAPACAAELVDLNAARVETQGELESLAASGRSEVIRG